MDGVEGEERQVESDAAWDDSFDAASEDEDVVWEDEAPDAAPCNTTVGPRSVSEGMWEDPAQDEEYEDPKQKKARELMLHLKGKQQQPQEASTKRKRFKLVDGHLVQL